MTRHKNFLIRVRGYIIYIIYDAKVMFQIRAQRICNTGNMVRSLSTSTRMAMALRLLRSIGAYAGFSAPPRLWRRGHDCAGPKRRSCHHVEAHPGGMGDVLAMCWPCLGDG